jgi:hypothetical protein
LIQPEKYQSAYGNKLALLERRMQTGYESSGTSHEAICDLCMEILYTGCAGVKSLNCAMLKLDRTITPSVLHRLCCFCDQKNCTVNFNIIVTSRRHKCNSEIVARNRSLLNTRP